MLAAVQQNRLHTVTVSQEEGVALTARQIPNVKTIRELQKTQKEQKKNIYVK